MTPEQKKLLRDAADLLRTEGRFFYDQWKRSLDAPGTSIPTQGRLAYDKYAVLQEVAGRIDAAVEEILDKGVAADDRRR